MHGMHGMVSMVCMIWYACRHGIHGRVCMVWYGIHDMHGNVSEYCKDLYVPKLPGGTDPLINIHKANIVFRGGGWCSTASYCRAGFRQHRYVSHNDRGRPFLGLRIVLGKDIKASKKAKK